jgi:CHAT domain-containing protein
VLVSLWSVADEATAAFMVDFYGRVRSGQDKATALMETKRQMMDHPEHPEYRDPFYWAAFVLQGEWTNSD